MGPPELEVAIRQGDPLHLWLRVCKNEKSQGSPFHRDVILIQRPLTSRVSSPAEDGEWRHCAHCRVSPPERAEPQRGTDGRRLSQKPPEELWRGMGGGAEI